MMPYNSDMSELVRSKHGQRLLDQGGYSIDTEILTRYGWKLFSDLADDDEVATRSEAGHFEWQTPAEFHCYWFDGELVKFSNKSIDLLVTPNHWMLVRRLAEKNHPISRFHDWHAQQAGYFAARPFAKYEVVATSQWAGVQPPTVFHIPGRPSARRRPAHEHATEWLARFLTEPWTPAVAVWAAARAEGVKEKALAGARRNLGVTMRRVGFGPGARWEMSAPTRKHVPADAFSHLPLRGFSMPMKDFCVFLGLFLAEGWVVKGREDIIVSQSPKSLDLPEIRGILATTGLRWRYDPGRRKFTTQHKIFSEWLGENTGHRAWRKYVPPIFKDYTPELLEALLRGMMIGDGETRPLGQRRYHTTSARLADDVQEIFQKLGVDAWVKRRSESKPSKLVAGKTGFHQAYTVFERLRGIHGLPHPIRRAYHGNVYSLTLPNSVVYVRRNGRAVWCGRIDNSPAVQARGAITDDIDGSEEAQTVTFGLDGQTWLINLGKKNRDKFRRDLAPYIAVARRTSR